MALIWLKGSETHELSVASGLLDTIRKKQTELVAFEDLGDIEACRICGYNIVAQQDDPSEGDEDESRTSLIQSLFIKPAKSKFSQFKSAMFQSNIERYRLCHNCRSRTTGWFGGEYARFAKAAAAHASPANVNTDVAVSGKFLPGRIIRQALVNICAASQPGVCIKYKNIKSLVTDRYSTADLGSVKLGLYINADKNPRSSGVTVFADTAKERVEFVAEYSSWPLGWILTLGGVSFDGTLDVTQWSLMKDEEKADLNLQIPCRWNSSPYPGDFRDPEDLKRTI